VLYDGAVVTRQMLPPPLNGFDPNGRSGPARSAVADRAGLTGARGQDGIRPLRDIEKEAIEHAIAHFGDNIPQAAAALGVSPSTIYRKRQTWHAEEA